MGRIYAPSGEYWWAREYALLPTADLVDEETIRVYVASLDERRHGRIGYVDLDAADPSRILAEAKEPVLDIGELGEFDDSGVNPSCIVTDSGKKYLYYIGWQRSERVPYMLFAGLAVSDDNGLTFKKYSRVPILDRTDEEPYSRSAPCITAGDGNLRMWYWSCKRWSIRGDQVHYNNVIRKTYSIDGLDWHSQSDICIEPDNVNEYSVGRPWVMRNDAMLGMWYSIRSFENPYSIGYAESTDGEAWERKDGEVGIARSDSGWDSQMICHPCIVDAQGKRYMFYNGNRHGQSGFGYAILES